MAPPRAAVPANAPRIEAALATFTMGLVTVVAAAAAAIGHVCGWAPLN